MSMRTNIVIDDEFLTEAFKYTQLKNKKRDYQPSIAGVCRECKKTFTIRLKRSNII